MESRSLRVVDLWAAGKWLTVDDNVVYLPSFARQMRSDAQPVPEEWSKTFVARLPPDEFVAAVEEAADLLDDGFGTQD